MTNTSQARKRQRRNKSRSKAEAQNEARRASARIAEDIELGRLKRLRMCTGKRRYDTELKAIRAAIESSATFGNPFRYYQCPHCGLWHLSGVHETEKAKDAMSEAVYHGLAKQAMLVEQSTLQSESPLENRYEIAKFAIEYLSLYSDASTDEERLIEGFRERCEDLGFELACGDRFARSYPINALYETESFLEVVGSIDDVKLLGSAVFFHWGWVTHWAEESLLSEENRKWFIVAFQRFRGLQGLTCD